MGSFGTDRHQPPGQWVQATLLTAAAGISHRKENALQFAQAVKKAEARGLAYGLTLERQSNNRHDPNAIALFGVADVKGLFGMRRREWHIGFVPAEVAADVVPDLIDQGIPVGAELYRIYEGQDGFLEVKFFILAPPGHGHAKRARLRGDGDT